jgi:hypothetical protein
MTAKIEIDPNAIALGPEARFVAYSGSPMLKKTTIHGLSVFKPGAMPSMPTITTHIPGCNCFSGRWPEKEILMAEPFMAMVDAGAGDGGDEDEQRMVTCLR